MISTVTDSDALWDFAEHRWRQGRVALHIAETFWLIGIILTVVNDIPGALTCLAGAICFAALGFVIWKGSLRDQGAANAMLAKALESAP